MIGLGAFRWIVFSLNVIETVVAFALAFALVFVYLKLSQNQRMLRDVCDRLDKLASEWEQR